MRLAVLGDLHGCFDPTDVLQLDARGLDLVCFVGDLGTTWHRDTLRVARDIGRLRTPAVVVPGNHDATSPVAVALEGLGILGQRPGAGARSRRRVEALRRALGPVALGGYTRHPLGPDRALIVGRPHAMGRWPSFPAALSDRFGVRSFAESAARLRALVDGAPASVLFLAHLGARGLGGGPRDPHTFYGRADLGDPDLADAVAYARASGRRVLAVLSGHLHHVGTDRDWQRDVDGVLHVNAARVPRWFRGPAGPVRHHVEVELGPDGARAQEILLESPGARW